MNFSASVAGLSRPFGPRGRENLERIIGRERRETAAGGGAEAAGTTAEAPGSCPSP
ncbi:hypothetical protein [Frigoriglobus tundricola]|uniref:hypothetical protein n=1 Tax=Frigoriglobus tundricola TaxID=2774151 RepID=UPI00148ED064|nr:hypothetical protein [Frigoriglobus tundricola]